MSKPAVNTRVSQQRPVNRFSTLDNAPARVAMLSGATIREIVEATGISAEIAKCVVVLARKRPPKSVYDLLAACWCVRRSLDDLTR